VAFGWGGRAIEIDKGEVHRRRAGRAKTYQAISKSMGISLRTTYRNSKRQGVA